MTTEEYKKEKEEINTHGNGCLIALFITLISGASVLIPIGLMYLFKIELSIINYIYTALSSVVVLILFVIIDTRTKNKKPKDENSQQSN